MELTNKTLNLDVQKEYQNEKFVLSGVRQIRLGYLPAGVKIWISTENTGDNLYSLDVKGDGWKDLPEPLYDLYITTKGTSQEKLVLYYSGESSDYYAVGNATTEQVNRVNSIESFSPNLLAQLANINNIDTNINFYDNGPLQVSIQGSFNFGYTRIVGYYVCLPFGLNATIQDLNFNDDDFYKISIFGHFDIGSNDTEETSQDGNSIYEIAGHFALFNNTNGATYSQITNQNFDNFYLLSKTPWATKKDLFDFIGLKYLCFQHKDSGYSNILENQGLNLGKDNIILKGSFLNQFQKFGLFWNILNTMWGTNGRYQKPQSHASLVITISKAFSINQFPLNIGV